MERRIPWGAVSCLAVLVALVAVVLVLVLRQVGQPTRAERPTLTPATAPETAEATPAVTSSESEQSSPAPPRLQGDLTIVTWNLEWFFDWDLSDNRTEVAKTHAAPTRRDWEWRLDATADALAKLRPTVVCLQEIENRKVMNELAQRLRDRHQLDYEVGFAQGRDVSTEQDVAILVRTGLKPTFHRAPEPRNFDRDKEKQVSKQLMLDLDWPGPAGARRLSIINVHMLAGGQVGQELDRCAQARYIKRWIRQEHRLGHDVILVGDMNTAKVPEAREHPLDILSGRDTPEDAEDDLVDVTQELKPQDRITFGSRKSELDHILISPRLKSGTGLKFADIANRRDVSLRGSGPDFKLRQADKRFWRVDEAERDLSDHYPLFATFSGR